MTDYAPEIIRAIDYARHIVDGDVVAGSFVRAAAKRFLDDLAAADDERSPWVFEQNRALAPIRFAGMMVNVKGPLTGRRVELLDFQLFILANLFGFAERTTGLRRFRQASVWVPRGNGKSVLAAILALAVTFFEDEGGAEGYSAAVSRAQASIVFDFAKQMALRNEPMRRELGIQVNAHAISQARTGSKFSAISSDAKALDGLNVHFAVCDEIGSHRSSAVYDVLITAMGKRIQPLLISISTATANHTGIGRQVWNYTEQVLSGAMHDDRFFGVIYAADPEDDPWDETTWRKANPGWGVMVQPDALHALAKQALASPALQAAFKTRHLNIWVSANRALFNTEAWAACADPELRIEDLRGEPCFVGIDAAGRSDIFGAVVIFPRTDDDGKTRYLVFAKAWLPKEAVDPDRNPLYVQWSELEALTITEGATTDFAAVEDWLHELAHEYDIRSIGFDPYMLLQFGQRLINEGYPAKEYRSSVLNFSEPTKLLDALMRDKLLAHDGDPVLGWCISNVVGHYDARSNVYPRKESPERKIDCAIALIMALGISIASEKDAGGYIYQDRGLLVF